MVTKEDEKQVTNREFKSSVFTAYFGSPDRAADLYRALSHVPDVKPEDIQYETLQGIIYMARKNDMAFTVKKRVLIIGEHQSTINYNIPTRSVIYYGRTMERLIPPREIYRTGIIPIPTPEFYAFYNGKKKQPMEQIIKLSDSYLEKTDEPMLELKVKVININPSMQHPILQTSRSVYEYSWFIQRIREYMDSGHSRDEAIALAMKDCMKEGIMVDFIGRHGSEVRNMLFTEFNLQDAQEVWFEEGKEEGKEEGRVEGAIEICRDLGTSRDDTLECIVRKFSLSKEHAARYMDQYW